MKRKSGSEYVFLLSMAIIFAVVWIGFEAYRTITRVPTDDGVEQLLTPLSPQLNTEVFTQLQDKTQ